MENSGLKFWRYFDETTGALMCAQKCTVDLIYHSVTAASEQGLLLLLLLLSHVDIVSRSHLRLLQQHARRAARVAQRLRYNDTRQQCLRLPVDSSCGPRSALYTAVGLEEQERK